VFLIIDCFGRAKASQALRLLKAKSANPQGDSLQSAEVTKLKGN